MAATAMAAMVATTARGPLMPMPTTAMEVMPVTAVDTVTDTARGPLMPMPTTADTAMADTEATAMVDTARGLLMPMPTTAMEVMAVTAVYTATAMASKFVQVCNNILI